MPEKFSTFSEIGTTGLDEWNGVIRTDFLRELRGIEGYKRYREMSYNNPVIGALLLAIEHPIRNARWSFESEQGEDDKRLQLLNDSEQAMSIGMSDHISEALTMLSYGYSVFEIVYRRDAGGRILWHKFAPRGQDTVDHWEFTDGGGLAGVHQRAAPKYLDVLIPIERMLLYRTRVERNNPEGRSILRNAWTSYYYLRNIQQIEGIGIERDLAGLPVVKLPQGATTDSTDANSDAYKAAKMVRNIRRDEQEGIVLPDNWELELLSTGGTRQFDTNAIIQRYESRILMSTLTQFLMLGQAQVGTQALSKDQTDFFTMSLNHIADIIADAITKYAIPRLCELNGVDPEGLSYTHSPVGDVDIMAVADFLQKCGSMITWMPQDEVWLRALAKLPEVDPLDIEDERERKQQQAVEMMRLRGNSFGDKSDDKSDDKNDDKNTDKSDDKLEAELYAADNPPDDSRRRYWERRSKSLLAKLFGGQQDRVIKGAKRLQRK